MAFSRGGTDVLVSCRRRISGGVSCATITTTMKGTLDGHAFNGKFIGALAGAAASGLWDGKETSGSALTVWGTWHATKQ